MKYINVYLSLLAAVFLGCACDKVTEPVEEEQLPDNEAAFRASVGVIGVEDVTWARWEANKDKIGVFASNEQGVLCKNAYYHAFSSTAASKFKSAGGRNPLLWSGDAVADVCAYYPFRTSYDDPEAIPCSIPSQQTLARDLIPDIKSVVLYDSKADVSYADGLPQFQFRPCAAVLKISVALDKPVKIDRMTVTTSSEVPLAFDKGTLNLSNGVLTAAEGASQEILLTSAASLSVGTDGITFYLMVTPGHDSDKLSVKTIISRDVHEIALLDVPEGGFKGGVLYSYEASYNVPEKAFTNLSAQGTANTYIVNEASKTYGFNARVKGNGQARDFSWTFDGEPCNVSWGDVDITPHSVGILWYNTPRSADGQWVKACPIDPESLDYDPDKGIVYFSTPDEFVNGNAMIAAFDESGTILWSWNIWAVEDYDADKSARNVGRFTVMDRNLGALAGVEAARESDPIKAAHSIGHYYQWGRKDPLPAASAFSADQSPKWGLPTYTDIPEYQKGDGLIFTENRADNVYCMGGGSFTLQEAVEASVKHPHKSMANGTSDNNDPYHWAMPPLGSGEKFRTTPERSHWRTLWGSVDGYNSVKTIFDPCPPGWKVPTVDLYVYAFGGSRKTPNGYGYYSEKFDLFMPCGGQRMAGFGGSNFSAVGEAAMYASATANDSYTPLRGAESGMTANNSYGGASYQLRCVREDVLEHAAPVGIQTGKTAVLMGDSITEQWPIRGRREFFTENNYEGVGISGQTSRDMLDRFYRDVLSKSPQVVVVAAGTNDLAWNDGAKTCREDILNNVMMMIELARAWGSEVVVGSSFPSRHYWWNDGNSNWNLTPDQVAQGALDLWTILKAYADGKGYAFADYYNVLKDEENNLADEYCFVGGPIGAGLLDHVHPGAAGYAEMEKVLKPIIDQLLNHPDQINPGGSSIGGMDKVEW